MRRFDVEGAPPSPASWFAAAAEHGMSATLEAEVVRRALAAGRELPRDCFLSLNVSPEAVLSPELAEIFAAAGDLSRVVLEVTEQTKVADYGALEAALRPVRAAGALVAVDDTGAGYASLRHVLALSPDFVKLDRSLVANLHREPRRAAAVSAIGALAAELDAAVVAEAREHGAELASLARLDVPLAQGYLLGRPGPQMSHLTPALVRTIRNLDRVVAAQTARDLAEGRTSPGPGRRRAGPSAPTPASSSTTPPSAPWRCCTARTAPATPGPRSCASRPRTSFPAWPCARSTGRRSSGSRRSSAARFR